MPYHIRLFTATALGLAGVLLAGLAAATTPMDPFAVLDPQNWVNPDDMTWDDFVPVPGVNWSDPTRRGSNRNFNIALIAVDFEDQPFVITLEPNSTIFGNPQVLVPGLEREAVPAYYRDLLNMPSEANWYHTMHEYWMEDSGGRFGVNLTSFGPYRMSAKHYQYGITSDFNPGACPTGDTCGMDLASEAIAALATDVGNDTAHAFELTFIISAGQDESSSWQEFGEMKFQTDDDVPDNFGPPDDALPNYAKTRYVDWTSWAAAAQVWPAAGYHYSIQTESSGMATYAHELSHILGIGDNYNNPYDTPLRRDYTGPWSILSRGSFNGPGGPHTRWKIPSMEGGSMGSLHTVRDKWTIGLTANEQIYLLARDDLAASGTLVANVTARCVERDGGLMALRVTMSDDLSPPCDIATDVVCDGGGYMAYDLEVVDRMGADSFQPDAGVMISKVKGGNNAPFQWVIDANPQDIELVDFVRPNGSAAMITMGDYRQLADALFHAGTRSRSQFEYEDAANRLHFYVVDKERDEGGVLSYTIAARSLDGSGSNVYGVSLGAGVVESRAGSPTGPGVSCVFRLANNGTIAAATTDPHFGWDVYRLSAAVEGEGWRIEVPNALAAAAFGASTTARVAVAAAKDAAPHAAVRLTATSESDPSAVSTAECQIAKARLSRRFKA